MKFLSSQLVLAALLSLVLLSCRKEEDKKDSSPNSDVAVDLAAAEKETNQLFSIGLDAVNYSGQDPDGKRSAASFYINNCVNVTVNPAWPDTTYPKTIVLDFGSGCLGADNRVRSGVLEIIASNRYRVPTASYTVATNNFFVDGNQVEGTKTVTNMGYNSSNNLVFDVEVSAIITRTSGDSIVYTSSRQREWINGESTHVFNNGVGAYLDDEYAITGSASGVSSVGTAFTSNIDQPLIVKLSCPFITQGILEFTPQGGLVRTLDYGTGNCDNQVDFSVGNFSITLTL